MSLLYQLLKELELLEPYGQCNEEMKFVLKDITNFTSRVLSDGKHLRFDIPLNKGNLQALYFNCSNEIEQLQQKKDNFFNRNFKN